MVNLSSFLSRIITAAKNIGASKSSWMDWKLPKHRQHNTVKNHYNVPTAGKTSSTVRSEREKKARYDPQGNPIDWKTHSNIPIHYPGLEHVKGHISNTTKHHVVQRHPECTPKDTLDSMSKPDKVTMHYENNDSSNPENLRLLFYKGVGKYKDGTTYGVRTPAIPIADEHGNITAHARTTHSSANQTTPGETHVNIGDIHEAAHHNKNAGKTG